VGDSVLGLVAPLISGKTIKFTEAGLVGQLEQSATYAVKSCGF
jgi:hypothetical protein